MGALIKEECGTKHGYWQIVSFHQIDSHGDARWWCKCGLCGCICSVKGFTLRNGKSTHCINCNPAPAKREEVKICGE